MDKIRILFVCLGNICRSPSAEAVMKALVEKKGVASRFDIDSAGVIGYHEGNPADARMQRHAKKRGYNLTSISRPVKPAVDFNNFDIIIGMDDQNIRDLLYMAPDDDARNKIYKMTSFAGDSQWSEVPDPYYGGDAGFELVLDILEVSCEGLYGFLMKD
ncbi:low molecular weight protein-tyrosine-phosphatase [Alkaliflexus imshenetskii]|uniref:low molecular weight protein-tyrosine-phosphatase n=1 Tax=Alkaliflexus imshenetskii TaxID=286730 RepID=UPI00047B541A|nr:low molecular weight protein-tyrosine-phosphatase [Alkaliflexus imshenetskii]